TPADVGAGSSYVSDKLMKMDFNPDVEAGPEISDRGASGGMIRIFKLPDLIKRYTISIQIGTSDPELEWILTGGTILTSSATALSAMGTVSSSTATTGGSLVAATYGYKVTALSSYGETAASAEKTQVVPSGTSTNTVTLTWTAITGAVGYRIYGRTGGGPWQVINQVAQATSPTWTDTGAITPDPSMVAPSADTSGTAVNGYSYPAVGADPNPYGVSIEAWAHNVAQPGTPGYPAGQIIGQAPYIRWVFPMIHGLRKANRSLDVNPVDGTFDGGYATENSQWGNGPFNDWLYDSSKAVQWTYDIAANLPTVQVGRVQIPTQV
ncbi:MAG TPA: hypothetical protein VGL21_05900, partial [Jatrophihabitantaceae bacterium]